jgi:hypothetical protein
MMTMMENEYKVLEQNNLGVAHLINNGDLDSAHQHLRGTAFPLNKKCVTRHGESQRQGQSDQQRFRRPSFLSSPKRQDSIEILKQGHGI